MCVQDFGSPRQRLYWTRNNFAWVLCHSNVVNFAQIMHGLLRCFSVPPDYRNSFDRPQHTLVKICGLENGWTVSVTWKWFGWRSTYLIITRLYDLTAVTWKMIALGISHSESGFWIFLSLNYGIVVGEEKVTLNKMFSITFFFNLVEYSFIT